MQNDLFKTLDSTLDLIGQLQLAADDLLQHAQTSRRAVAESADLLRRLRVEGLRVTSTISQPLLSAEVGPHHAAERDDTPQLANDGNVQALPVLP